jgi:hypothetical protein
MSPLSASPLHAEQLAVKFESNVSTRVIQSASLLSDDEFRSIWYTQDELFKIKLHATETVLVMMANSDEFPAVDDENSDEYCSRGLRTKEEFSHRHSAICKSVDAILEEQHAQRQLRIHDDELFADIYFEFTWDSQEEATDRAEAHARANKDLWSTGIYQEHHLATKDCNCERREDTFHDYPHEIATEAL